MDWARWQDSWDAQQQLHLPDREERFAAMLDVVEVLTTEVDVPCVLDLAGGTGSITRRLLRRFPRASSVVLDVDPALLAIATGTFDGDARVRVREADLATPAWVDGFDAGSFDAVLTATALHWLPADRVGEIYAEAHSLLRPGGVLVNADHMPDSELGALGDELRARAHEHSLAGAAGARTVGDAAANVAGGDVALEWEAWWALLGEEPEMRDLVDARNRHFAERAGNEHAQSQLDEQAHRGALRAAGFARVGVIWRHLGDAVIVAQRD